MTNEEINSKLASLEAEHLGYSPYAEALRELSQLRAERDAAVADWINKADEVANRLTTEAYDILFEGEPESEREPRWKWVVIELRNLKAQLQTAIADREKLAAVLKSSVEWIEAHCSVCREIVPGTYPNADLLHKPDCIVAKSHELLEALNLKGT